MALETNAFATYEAIGNREDLANAIYRIDPVDTPFVSGIEKTEADATKHEWQTQALATAAVNKQLEGDAFSAAAATATVRLANYCQIAYKVARVTNTQRVVKHAGRGDEMTYQMMLKGLELRRDIEVNLLSNQAYNAGADATARAHASVLSWLKSNTSKGASGSDPSAADGTGTRTDGTQRAFTESLLKTVLQSIWTNGGKPDTVMTGAFNKQAFSLFTGRSTPMEQASSKKIVAAVSAYESDFGTMKVVANRFLRSSGREALVLQMDMWAKATLRDFNTVDIAITGDSVSKAVVTEYTLEARNEKASGIVADLTTS